MLVSEKAVKVTSFDRKKSKMCTGEDWLDVIAVNTPGGISSPVWCRSGSVVARFSIGGEVKAKFGHSLDSGMVVSLGLHIHLRGGRIGWLCREV